MNIAEYFVLLNETLEVMFLSIWRNTDQRQARTGKDYALHMLLDPLILVASCKWLCMPRQSVYDRLTLAIECWPQCPG